MKIFIKIVSLSLFFGCSAVYSQIILTLTARTLPSSDPFANLEESGFSENQYITLNFHLNDNYLKVADISFGSYGSAYNWTTSASENQIWSNYFGTGLSGSWVRPGGDDSSISISSDGRISIQIGSRTDGSQNILYPNNNPHYLTIIGGHLNSFSLGNFSNASETSAGYFSARAGTYSFTGENDWGALHADNPNGYLYAGTFIIPQTLTITVPEPSALSLLAVGLGVVLRRRRRTV